MSNNLPEHRTYSTTSSLSELSDNFQALSIDSNESHDDERASGSSNIIAGFADPTYDVTFKILFGKDSDSSKKMFCSLANIVLKNYDDYKEINKENIQIKNNDLIPVSQNIIMGAVDVLCSDETTSQIIALEMQRCKTTYFFARVQDYASRLIASQTQTGKGQDYNKAIFKTYVITIAKDSIFTGNTALKVADAGNLFHLDFEIRSKQTNETLPDNKLHLTFCELSKFRKSTEYKNINQESDMEAQWLHFLVECSNMEEIPRNVNDLIKEAYSMMKLDSLSELEKTLYWRQKGHETTVEEQVEEQVSKRLKIEQEAAVQKEKIEAKIGAIEGLKDAIKYNLSHDTLVKFFKTFKEGEITSLESHLNEHEQCSCDNTVLAQLMGVVESDTGQQ